MTITIDSTTVLAVSAVCFCLGCWRAFSSPERLEPFGFPDIRLDGCLVALAFAGVFLVALGFALARWWL